jgi:hypothetical protein
VCVCVCVLRVSDHARDESSLHTRTHASFTEQATFFYALRTALLKKDSRLEAVLVVYGGVTYPSRRLVRRLAAALQVVYARHDALSEKPDFPTKWRGCLLNYETTGGGEYSLDEEYRLYKNR